MTLTLTFPSLIYLVAVVLGAIISLICWFYPNHGRSFPLLGASVFCIAWTLLIFFISESNLIYSVPHLFQTGFITSILYLPFSYLFVRRSLQPKPITWKDLVHLLPLVVFLIDYSTIYLLPTSEKLQLIAHDIHSGYIYNQGWFIPAHLHRTFRFLLFIIYSGLQFNIALRSSSPHRKNVLYYLAAQFFMIFYYFIYQFAHDPFAWRSSSVIISFYLLFIAVALLLHPRILYNFEGRFNANYKKDDLTVDRDLKNAKKIQQICTRLEGLMASESPYLRHGYSLNELSGAIHIPSYQLSAILNQYIKLSFHEYLNMHRIAYCKTRILTGAAEMVTLEALAYECGFNNRNSFTSAFKQFSGTTPSNFLRTQRNLQPGAKDS
jgi:AraC-like DNA-binding protein